MQIFAVILAAIAALAATGQAYLLWQDRSHADAQRLHERRVALCEAALNVLANTENELKSTEKSLAEVKADGLSDAEKVRLSRARPGTYLVMMHTGYASIYLSESEYEALGLNEIEALPDVFDYDSPPSEDDLNAKIDAYRAAAGKFESAKAVCAPIMLGKVK